MDSISFKLGIGFVLLLFIYIVGTTFFVTPIYIWDEAIYANNALEMSHSHNAFVMTLDRQPDLYNTKPPLGIWLMAISIKLFGANEFAVRLPSVVAFLSVLLVLFRFSKKQFGSNAIGIFAGIVLLGSKGLLISHGVRSGDLDSLVLLCTTVLVLGTFSLLLDKEVNKGGFTRKLVLLASFILAGFLIKSTTIFLLLPGLTICLLISENRAVIIKQRMFYLLPLALLIIITLYYIMMGKLHPGYNRQVLFSEYKRIYGDIMPWHKQPAHWYLQNLIRWRFTPFIYFLIPAFLLGFLSGEKIIRRFTLFSTITVTVFLLVISIVPDKLEWYDLPVYPLFALIIGTGMYEVIKRISNIKGFSVRSKFVLFWIFIVILSVPVIVLRKDILSKDILHEFEKEAYSIRQIKCERPGIKNITVLMEIENPLHRLSIDFYRKAYHYKLTVKIASYTSELHLGDTVLCSQPGKIDSLKNLPVDTLPDLKYGKLFIIQ